MRLLFSPALANVYYLGAASGCLITLIATLVLLTR